MTLTELSPDFAVSGQIEPTDVVSLSALGYTDIVCNRPDTEHPEGPVSSQIATSAARFGIRFHYLPVVPGEPTGDAAVRLAELLASDDNKVFAYCRSGARSTALWQQALAGTDV